jgi:3-hydroxybutyrate dehydrogenase
VIALEGATHEVTSNCIEPSYVRTPLVEGQIAVQAQAHGLPAEQVVERVMPARTATKRLVEPGEVTELTAFLCSPAADFITGRL